MLSLSLLPQQGPKPFPQRRKGHSKGPFSISLKPIHLFPRVESLIFFHPTPYNGVYILLDYDTEILTCGETKSFTQVLKTQYVTGTENTTVNKANLVQTKKLIV